MKFQRLIAMLSVKMTLLDLTRQKERNLDLPARIWVAIGIRERTIEEAVLNLNLQSKDVA
jgi:hypothetical protein